MNPSDWHQLADYPDLRMLVADRLDPQFADLRTMLRLPIPREGLDAGANLTTATLLFNILAGSSVLFLRSSVEALESRNERGVRFKELLSEYYPWAEDDLHAESAAAALYEWARNPLAHSLGVGKDRRVFPGAPTVADHPVAIMIAKRPLDQIEVEAIATSRERHPALEPTLSLIGSELVVNVVTLAWGVHELHRRLFEDRPQAVEANRTARILLTLSDRSA